MIAGSVNQAGALVFVTRVGEETFLAQVAQPHRGGAGAQAGILQLVDRILKFYVPAVRAQMLPDQKTEAVREWQERGTG